MKVTKKINPKNYKLWNSRFYKYFSDSFCYFYGSENFDATSPFYMALIVFILKMITYYFHEKYGIYINMADLIKK